ncbi:MAG: DUF3570 domain-containing protein [Chlorobiaceae bacterium]|nr:DUF3570 domain-containing protein [Chlorobiaceae bacterium]NTW73594.1 DUF3570 domain-containing protein [Chlorobiaceae bacterium]
MKPGPTKKNALIGAAIAAAAISLPLPPSVFAESAPEKGIVAFKYLNYQDSQPSRDRIGVNAWSLRGMAPIAGKWSIDVTGTYDSVSGASPLFHNYIGPAPAGVSVVSGASTSSSTSSSSSTSDEVRKAIDLSVTRYLASGSITLGTSYSSESDYDSKSLSLLGNVYLNESKNTMLTLGASVTNDTIEFSRATGTVAGTAGDRDDDDDDGGRDDDRDSRSGTSTISENKDIVSGIIGVTQVMTKNDIIQLNVGYAHGSGYYTDPYKVNDNRPRKRNQTTFMGRWNHYFEATEGSARLSYRYYSDSFGIDAHTLGLDYVQPLPSGFTVTPSIRLYSQSAADFYVPSNPSILPTPPDTSALEYSSLDQRLSAFGAVTFGIKVQKRFDDGWLVDLKYDTYAQRSEWTINGTKDPGLEEFNAHFIQVGVSKEF